LSLPVGAIYYIGATANLDRRLAGDRRGKVPGHSDNLPEFSFGPSLKCRGKFGHSRIYHPEQSADKLVRGLQSGQDSFRELEKKLKVVTFDPSPEILPLFEGGVIQCHA
jgi:hypothetical protein